MRIPCNLRLEPTTLFLLVLVFMLSGISPIYANSQNSDALAGNTASYVAASLSPAAASQLTEANGNIVAAAPSPTSVSVPVSALVAALNSAENPGQQAVQLATRYLLLKTPYTWGGGHGGPGDVKRGFDCSGLVSHVVREATQGRVDLGYGTAAQMFRTGPFADLYRIRDGRVVPDTPKTGDLVFFRDSTGDIPHVGLVVRPLNNGDALMIHAAAPELGIIEQTVSAHSKALGRTPIYKRMVVQRNVTSLTGANQPVAVMADGTLWVPFDSVLAQTSTNNVRAMQIGQPAPLPGPSPTPTAGPATVAGVYTDASGRPSWDVNGDHICSILDISAIQLKPLQTGQPGWIPEDVNRDGVVNALDVAAVGMHMGETW